MCVPVKWSTPAESPQEPCGDSRPRLSGAGEARLLLHNARHPLLERNLKLKGLVVVPISVELEGKRRQLVITGPNTGGKTVTRQRGGPLGLSGQARSAEPAAPAELSGIHAVRGGT